MSDSEAMDSVVSGPEAIDLISASSFAGRQPHDQFRWLRSNAPVFRHEQPNGTWFWAVTRFEDVKAIGRDHERFSSTPTVMLDDPSASEESPFGDHVMMLYADPPLHTRMRRMVSRDFTPRAAEALRPRVAELATRIVDDVIERGECDLVNDLAGAMPSYMIADLLGIPLADGLDLYRRTEVLHSSEEGASREEKSQALGEMFAYSQDVYADRMTNPTDDLASSIAHGEVGGEPIDAIDFFLWFLLLVDAGGDTTRNLVGAGFHALFQHPSELARLRADVDGLLPTAVEELLRWVSPVIHMRRTATVDTTVGDQAVAAGDRVVMFYGAANRDPSIFDDPERLDLGRSPNPHVAFGGGGPHFCMGASLARVEIDALLRAMLTRLEDLVPSGEPTWMQSNFIFGPTSMPVTFQPGVR